MLHRRRAWPACRAVTLPDADTVQDAIASCPFVVVSDITAATDTARQANVLLPATAWAEKSGTVTNSDRTISRQRAALAPPGAARPDWAILAEVAQRMGFAEGFNWDNEAEIFAEYAALSGLARTFGKDFDISNRAKLSSSDYDSMPPFRWPDGPAKSGGRFFEDGGFYHPDGKARMLALAPRAPAAALTPEHPFRLNTGRLRDQWHTMTRTALSPRLSAHLPEPFVDMHPDDAARLGLAPADLLRLESPQGSAILRLRITRDVQPGHLFAPMHWTGETAPSARIDALIASVTDPVSGQPESKAAAVSAARFEAAWYGFAIATARPRPECAYWALARTDRGFRAELAGTEEIADAEDFARALFGLPDAALQMSKDMAKGRTRLAFMDGEILLAALYLDHKPVRLMRDFLAGLPGTETPWALAGTARGDMPDPGPVVCSCYAVGRNTILRAIGAEGLQSVEAIGASLSAGTNCGSCKAELAALLQQGVSRAAE